jgi:hypothetical protein
MLIGLPFAAVVPPFEPVVFAPVVETPLVEEVELLADPAPDRLPGPPRLL